MTDGKQRLLTFAGGMLVIAVMITSSFVLVDPPAREAADGTGVRRALVPIAVPGAARHPDSARLRTYSELAGVPVAVTFAIAWQETRNNATDSTVRSVKRALGRFQIMDATARTRCPAFDVGTPDGNLACFLKMVCEDAASCGDYGCAARIHNGRGYAARAFADTVLMNVGRLHLYWESVR